MSFLGIDVGTTGCKAVVFSEAGAVQSSAYSEYDVRRPRPSYAELDSGEVWGKIKATISRAAHGAAPADPIRALAVASMGETVVPVSKDREILGPSILIIDERGTEEAELLRRRIDDESCYAVSGNPVGTQFGLPKLMWLRRHEEQLYERTWKFLNWSGFVAFMLGAEPTVDFSLANRMLLFDLAREDWSPRLLEIAGIDGEKLPNCAPAGSLIGRVPPAIAEELGLPANTPIAAGTHDQCANALGSGTLAPGEAMYGMGTFPTIVPVFTARKEPAAMVPLGLNTEHHAAPGRYVTFIYHSGGSIIKWYRDTFAAGSDHSTATDREGLYAALFDEMPEKPGPLLVLPHFAPMGPPDFLADSAGIILGLKTYSRRGDVLRAVLEGNTFALRISVDELGGIGIPVEALRAVGGGSRSDTACRICADILNRPVVRPAVREAGALGAAMLAGSAVGSYSSLDSAAEELVAEGRRFEPDRERVEIYGELYEKYLRLRRLTVAFTQEWSSWRSGEDARGGSGRR